MRKKMMKNLILIAVSSFVFFFFVGETKALTIPDLNEYQNSYDGDVTVFDEYYVTYDESKSSPYTITYIDFDNVESVTWKYVGVGDLPTEKYPYQYFSISFESVDYNLLTLKSADGDNWELGFKTNTSGTFDSNIYFDSSSYNLNNLKYSSFRIFDLNGNLLFYEDINYSLIEFKKENYDNVIKIHLSDLINDDGSFKTLYYYYLPIFRNENSLFDSAFIFEGSSTDFLYMTDLVLGFDFVDYVVPLNVDVNFLDRVFSVSSDVTTFYNLPNFYVKKTDFEKFYMDEKIGLFRIRVNSLDINKIDNLENSYLYIYYNGFISDSLSEANDYFVNHSFDDVDYSNFNDILGLYDKFFNYYSESIDFVKDCFQILVNSLSVYFLMGVVVLVLTIILVGFLKRLGG